MASRLLPGNARDSYNSSSSKSEGRHDLRCMLSMSRFCFTALSPHEILRSATSKEMKPDSKSDSNIGNLKPPIVHKMYGAALYPHMGVAAQQGNDISAWRTHCRDARCAPNS